MCSQDGDTARAAARNMAVRGVRLSPSQAAEALRRIIPEPPGAPPREPPSTKKNAAPVQPCVNAADVGTCVYFVRACGALCGVTHAALEAVTARVGAGSDSAVVGAAGEDDVVPMALAQQLYITAARYVVRAAQARRRVAGAYVGGADGCLSCGQLRLGDGAASRVASDSNVVYVGACALLTVWQRAQAPRLTAVTVVRCLLATTAACSMDWMAVSTMQRDALGGARVTLGGGECSLVPAITLRPGLM